MNRSRWIIVGAVGLGLLVGAYFLTRGGSSTPRGTNGSGGAGKRDDLENAFEIFRQAKSIKHFREGLALVNSHLRGVEDRSNLTFSAKVSRLLRERYLLDDDELAEISATTFQALDAPYMEWCFLLRDAVRALEQPGAGPLDQVRLAFAWVMRQVRLQERRGDLLPPSFVLQRGYGTAAERALIFLDLVHQLGLEGCIVGLADAKSQQPADARSEPPAAVLVGVCIPHDDGVELYLFDPRLGAPLSGPDGKSIATWSQLRKQPQLFWPAGAMPEVDGKPEILSACPLSSLAARMKYLEEEFERRDKLQLHHDPAALLSLLEKTGGDKVRVWHARTPPGGQPARTPLRVLRTYLSTAEGGTDTSKDYKPLEPQLVPNQAFLRVYIALKLVGDDGLTADAHHELMLRTIALYGQYGLAPRGMLLRGQYMQAKSRLGDLRQPLELLEIAHSNEAEFRKRVLAWRNEVNRAYLAVLNREPVAALRVNQIWAEDQFLLALLEARTDLEPTKFQKKILSDIVLSAVRDVLGPEGNYQMAQCWQEIAERATATVHAGRAADRDRAADREGAAKAAEIARKNWNDTRGWWHKYVERYALSARAQRDAFAEIQSTRKSGDLFTALALWEPLFGELHKSCTARWNLAHAYAGAHQPQKAAEQFLSLSKDLKALLEQPDWLQELAAQRDATTRSDMRAYIDNFVRDLGPDGGFAWLYRAVQIRLKELEAN